MKEVSYGHYKPKEQRCTKCGEYAKLGANGLCPRCVEKWIEEYKSSRRRK